MNVVIDILNGRLKKIQELIYIYENTSYEINKIKPKTSDLGFLFILKNEKKYIEKKIIQILNTDSAAGC